MRGLAGIKDRRYDEGKRGWAQIGEQTGPDWGQRNERIRQEGKEERKEGTEGTAPTG